MVSHSEEMDGVDDVPGEQSCAGQECPALRSLEGAPGESGKQEADPPSPWLPPSPGGYGGQDGGGRNGNGAGATSPQPLSPGGEASSGAGGERLDGDQGMEDEGETIARLLKRRLESAPAHVGRVGPASALAWAGLKLAAAVLLAAGVGVGLGDRDELDSGSSCVAHQPGRTSRGAHSTQARERGEGKVPGSGGGSDGGSGDGGPGERPECEVRAKKCPNRAADGQCQQSQKQCLLFASAVGVREMVARLHRGMAAVRKHLLGLHSEWRRLEGSGGLRDDELRKIYAGILLMAREEPGGRAGALKEVFDYYCLKGFSAREVSVKLGCSKATVMIRLAMLRAIAGVPAIELRAYKPFFEETERALREPRARRVRPEDATYGDDPPDEGGYG